MQRLHLPLSRFAQINQYLADQTLGTAATAMSFGGVRVSPFKRRSPRDYHREYLKYKRMRRLISQKRPPTWIDPKELKFHDLTFGFQPIETWGPLTSINLITQGVTETDRIGRQIKVHSVHIRGKLQLDEDTTGKDSIIMRWALILDRQANGANPAALDIWELNDFITHRNLANRKRFTILSAGQRALNRSGSAGSEVVMPFNLNYRFKRPLPIEFDSTVGVITEIKSNNLIFMLVRSNLDGTQAAVSDLFIRVRFTG